MREEELIKLITAITSAGYRLISLNYSKERTEFPLGDEVQLLLVKDHKENQSSS